MKDSVVSTGARSAERRDLFSTIGRLSLRKGLSARPCGPRSRRRGVATCGSPASQGEGRHHFHSCRQSSRTDAGSASKSNRRRRRMSKAVAEIAENAEIPFGFLVTEKEQA